MKTPLLRILALVEMRQGAHTFVIPNECEESFLSLHKLEY